MSKFWWRFFFFFIVVANVYLSIINSVNMYQIELSPRGDIFVSYCRYCLNVNGPTRMQYLGVCQEGTDGSFLLL